MRKAYLHTERKTNYRTIQLMPSIDVRPKLIELKLFKGSIEGIMISNEENTDVQFADNQRRSRLSEHQVRLASNTRCCE